MYLFLQKGGRELISCKMCIKAEENNLALSFAAQEQALRTNYVKFNIDKSVKSPLCRLRKQKAETINHIVSECKMLANREYIQEKT